MIVLAAHEPRTYFFKITKYANDSFIIMQKKKKKKKRWNQPTKTIFHTGNSATLAWYR